MVRTAVIEASGLAIGYSHKRGKRIIVHDLLSFQLFAGEMTSLLGLNGVGKSTLLRTISRFQPAIAGQVVVNGRHLSDYSTSELSRTIGVVLTEKTLTGGITVYELVSLGRHPYTGFFGQLQAVDKQIVNESLEAVGIVDKATCFVSELSDGERQKAMIAKVLAQQCPIILLDEPTAFLDVASRIEILSLLRRLAVEQGKAILLSTHDLELAIQMSDRLWLLGKNRPIACRAPEDLILSGSFATFFDKEGIVFDVASGKLFAAKPLLPVAVSGDPTTAYWVGNALMRFGFQAVSIDGADTWVYCHSPSRFSFFSSRSEEIVVQSVEEVVAVVKDRVFLAPG